MLAYSIIAAARSEVGTPFHHLGRLPGIRLDCAGLVVHVANQIGADCLDVDGYSNHPSQGMLEAALDSQPCLRRVAINDRQPGDVLLMRFKGDPQHLAICAGKTIIHAYSNAGQVSEHRLSDVWAARIVRVYRFEVAA